MNQTIEIICGNPQTTCCSALGTAEKDVRNNSIFNQSYIIYSKFIVSVFLTFDF
ncbi:MAG: hypothetical protein WA061_06855 [Microgenomates group bacterium]